MGFSRKSFRVIFLAVLIFLISSTASFYMHRNRQPQKATDLDVIYTQTNEQIDIATPKPIAIEINYPENYEIPLRHHTFQTFNNCGPASLSMALSYFDVTISQITLGQQLRPYQNSNGDNDDKSTTLEELAAKAEELGFVSYHRPNGNEEILKKFISNDIPVITRTITQVGEDIGHYRVVRGYNKDNYIQDDSLQGKGLEYSLDEFAKLWKAYNFEFLVFVPKEKDFLAKQILAENADYRNSWIIARDNAISKLRENPDDNFARFNLSVAYYNIGEYTKSVEEFEKVQNKLSFRHLWYQIEPIEAYYHLGNYEKVFDLTDQILNNHNKAFSELYIIRGDIYKKQGDLESAKIEYQKAILYNQNLEEAKKSFESVLKQDSFN